MRIAGTEEEVRQVLAGVPGVKSVEAQGSVEPETFDFLVEAENEEDIRRPLFSAVSRAQLPVLLLKPVDLTLEEIFLQIITEEKEVS